MLGEEDIRCRTKSRSTGKSRSRTTTEHRTKRPLFAPEEFMGLSEGHCILVSPSYGDRKQRFVPLKLAPITITPQELVIETASKDAWDAFRNGAIAQGVGDRSIHPSAIEERAKDFKARLPVVERNGSGKGELKNLLADI